MLLLPHDFYRYFGGNVYWFLFRSFEPNFSSVVNILIPFYITHFKLPLLCQVLLFVPKVYPPLRRQVLKNAVKSKQLTQYKESLNRNCSKDQQQDNLVGNCVQYTVFVIEHISSPTKGIILDPSLVLSDSVGCPITIYIIVFP